jgi:hypothetical protein
MATERTESRNNYLGTDELAGTSTSQLGFMHSARRKPGWSWWGQFGDTGMEWHTRNSKVCILNICEHTVLNNAHRTSGD